MALTTQDLKEIKLTIHEVFNEREPRMFKEHIERCPYGKKINFTHGVIVGVAIVFLLIGSGVIAVAAKLVSW